jgi:hypothetical protein
MKLYWKLIITLVSFIPFFYKLNYLFDAWQYSPLDQNDFVFWLAALFLTGFLLLIWNYKKSGKEPVKGPDYYGFFMLGAAAALLAASLLKDINSTFLAGSLLFIAGVCWILWGWRVLWMLFPVFFIAALGLPSTTYWTSFIFRNFIQGISGFSIKLGFAAAAVIWLGLCLCFKKIFIRPEPFFFCLAIFIFILGYIQVSGPAPHGTPIRLLIKPKAADWLGENLPLSDLDESIQGRNISRRYLHFASSNIDVGTLAVELRNDLHGIHPTALCLATARWKIISNTQELLKTKQGILSAVKIIAERNGKRALFLAWYTNDSFSTGSFISFRKAWHYNETWYIYQITTPVITNEAEAEKILLSFINTFAIRG